MSAKRADPQFEAMLAKARRDLDPVSRADNQWRPVRLALIGLHRQLDEAGTLPPMTKVTRAELAPLWAAVSDRLAEFLAEAGR